MIKASELRKQSLDELKKQLIELRRKQFDLRIQHRTGQFADLAKFRDCRRDIARIKTIMNEQKLNG